MQKLKRGYFDEEKEMFFSHYKANGKEQWYSIKAWENRKKAQKEFNKTQKRKDYHKEWYVKNRDKKLSKSKIYTDKFIEEFPLKSLLSSAKSGAKSRKLVFEIDYTFIQYLWEKQQGLCFYTKMPMRLTARNKNPYQVSIDRINSNIGYTKNNSVLCCQSINYMKNDYDIDVFNDLIKSLQEALKLINNK